MKLSPNPPGDLRRHPDRQTLPWEDIAEQLENNPGMWANLGTVKTTVPSALSRGKMSAIKPRYGFVVKTTDTTYDYPRTCTLHIMYDPKRDQRPTPPPVR